MKRLVLSVGVTLLPFLTKAQCVMCRAVTESNTTLEQGSNIGEGLNNGILYLMAIPYLLLGTLVWVFYRNKIKALLAK